MIGAPALAAALSLATVAGNPPDCLEAFEPGRDYFPDKAKFGHSEGVRVSYHRHYKVVTLARPWPGAQQPLRYLLVQCGAPLPVGYRDAPDEPVQVFEVPARSLITTSTTELPHLVILGLVDRLLGHDELDHVSAPEIRARIDAGELVEVGSGTALDLEQVVAAGPDLLLADFLGPEPAASLARLRRLGVPVALVPSYLDASPVGRAEWVLLTALFFNREAAATRHVEAVAARYAELAALAAGASRRPLAITSGPVGETWHVPGGASFVARLLADAGARYPWAGDPSVGSLALAFEAVYARGLDADVWLQPSGWRSLAEIRGADSRLAALRPFRQGRVYANDRRRNGLGGNDYWESGSAYPDRVLADLIRILHPELLPEHDLIFHRKLSVHEESQE